MTNIRNRRKVGELRPSQLLFSYGVGAVVDLPFLSTMIMGLDDWGDASSREIGEERLRRAVEKELGQNIKRLLSPPLPDSNAPENLFGDQPQIGVPVAPFPRWMVCPYCHLLAPLKSELFKLKADPFRMEKTRYIHESCGPAKSPTALPARFLVACENGHLDDFPWVFFVHKGELSCQGPLRLQDKGVSGELADIRIACDTCTANRGMAEAFGVEGRKNLPRCSGRRPHLRDYAEDGCDELPKSILLGASNSWFPVMLTALAIPLAPDRMGRLLESHWHLLEDTESAHEIKILRRAERLTSFSEYSDQEVYEAIEKRRGGEGSGSEIDENTPLKVPEWQIFTGSLGGGALLPPGPDFRTSVVRAPEGYNHYISRVVLAERLREVRALIGFTRIESPGDFGEIEELPPERRGALSRKNQGWVPATEVRGEGIFIQFDEEAVAGWEKSQEGLGEHNLLFYNAHKRWRQNHHLEAEKNYPGIRYFLLHAFSHILMRQFALECGYTAASIRERIYSLPPTDDNGPMAGVLIYTAASDSEGTLGGLVRLGGPEELGRHLNAALEEAELCSADPLCSENVPSRENPVLHGAACHACLFVPETSCERGNKYLDRAVLVPTMEHPDLAFFKTGRNL